jgi:collagenase-like PrtC family protease
MLDAKDQQKQQRLPGVPVVKPEIMAPAGGFPQLKAAVANGADAVYVGLAAFSARARAANFDAEELVKAVEYCHAHDVHLYVALNTLIFDTEWTEIAQWIQACQRAKVDALIVQDVGLAKLIATIAPDITLHASTQQSITDADGVQFAAQYQGATRVVLGRELSIPEMIHIQGDLSGGQNEDNNTSSAPVEIEVFCHGALCVSYSGQCFSSEAWGGRSANRGQCAQACRLPYGLIVNGELRSSNQDMSYVLSPQDLSGVELVPQLIQAGVACLKIEGRLKDVSCDNHSNP